MTTVGHTKLDVLCTDSLHKGTVGLGFMGAMSDGLVNPSAIGLYG
jgi:hypothetical protein